MRLLSRRLSACKHIPQGARQSRGSVCEDVGNDKPFKAGNLALVWIRSPNGTADDPFSRLRVFDSHASVRHPLGTADIGRCRKSQSRFGQ